MKKEVMKVSWEPREFHRDETLLHCFKKNGCVANWAMKPPLRLA
jgi:hypothetical protein